MPEIIADSTYEQKSRPCIHVLWTGGLDSTARLVELSRKPVVVKPYYVIDHRRMASAECEMRAMQSIRERLAGDPLTIAEILPTIEIEVDDIASDPKVTTSFKELHRKYLVGSQYEYLTRYAKQHGIILEVGIEKAEGSKARASILAEAKVVPFEDETGGVNYKISEEDSSEDVRNLYQNYTFPMWEMDKHAEVKMMQDLGCGDIVNMTWFCHSPLWGKPCGHCNPCKDARHYGFGWRLSTSRTILWYFVRPKRFAASVAQKILPRRMFLKLKGFDSKYKG